MKRLKKGLFITFEGGEGCGKSTHVKLLAKYLSGSGYKVVKTYEPGATKVGAMIRKMLLSGKEKLDPRSEILLFGVDRAEHVSRVVKPAFEAKKIVISDRFIDSTIAYQLGGRKLSRGFVEFVNAVTSFGVAPNITLLLDISYKEGMLRVGRRAKKDQFEKEKKNFHDRVRNKYLEIARKDPKRVKVISTKGRIEDTQKRIRKIIDAVLVKHEK
ncbi:dTMP kinase [Candidatus Margulisiibacteriota bacterium]